MLHFAPRYGIISPCLHWGQNRRRNRDTLRSHALRAARAANDNGAAIAARKSGANDSEAYDEALLAAALRLFAAHGLSAAQRACEAAQIAADAGDSAKAEWWIAVCAMLDGPKAKALQGAFAARARSQA
ncbi:hypothetical protein NSE01_08810 [Novosphingobium sediminis]|uniref:Uncharacterized protein n=1 Tax=Novosphingobium sediminis TaxID=707214 RepID=A0A512AH64_9SPHN|nr:hypothetical protein [Novosphingobium sediminis]GEN99048.1 hypothetical protein NSE01_08810 [Novosphingobium sediminis]